MFWIQTNGSKTSEKLFKFFQYYFTRKSYKIYSFFFEYTITCDLSINIEKNFSTQLVFTFLFSGKKSIIGPNVCNSVRMKKGNEKETKVKFDYPKIFRYDVIALNASRRVIKWAYIRWVILQLAESCV